MRIWKSSMALLVGGLFAVAMPLIAQENAGHNGQEHANGHSSQAAAAPSHSAMNADQRAVDLLNTVNTSEIDTARIIQDKTKNDQVKNFASTLENDHKDAQDKLQSVASEASLSLNEVPSMKKQDARLDNQLKNESQERMDRAYVRAEIRDHEHAIHQLKQLESKIANSQVKQLVQSNIPQLQKHLDDARNLEHQLGHSGAAATPASNQGSNSNGASNAASGMGHNHPK